MQKLRIHRDRNEIFYCGFSDQSVSLKTQSDVSDLKLSQTAPRD